MQTYTEAFANNVDPDITAHNEPSHQDLYFLPFSFEVWNDTPAEDWLHSFLQLSF